MANLSNRLRKVEARLRPEPDEPSRKEKKAFIAEITSLAEPYISVEPEAERANYNAETLRPQFCQAVKRLRPTTPLAEIAWQLGSLAAFFIRNHQRRDEFENALQELFERPDRALPHPGQDR